MKEPHVLDDIPAYVLDALSEAEKQRVQKHVSGCDECSREAAAYQQMADSLPYSAPQYAPPAGLRSAILQKAAHSQKIVHTSFIDRITFWLRPFSSPVWGGVSLVLIVMLGASNLFLWQQNRQTVPQLSDFSLVQMAGEKSAANASGVIVISGDGNFGTLIVDGLPAMDSARQYQLWLIKKGDRTSGGVFSVLDNGYGVLIVNSPQPLSVYDAFGVTIEPAGGSPGPTGEKVLGGNI